MNLSIFGHARNNSGLNETANHFSQKYTSN